MSSSSTSSHSVVPNTVGTISFTAPRFTMEDWNQERKNLSPQELYDIQADIHGTHTVLRETLEMRTNGLEQLLQKLLLSSSSSSSSSSLLQLRQLQPVTTDNQDQKCLARALQETPQLVATDSNPLVFLRCEDFNVQAAARRLATYWNIRCKLFGGDDEDDRAYRPINDLSGNGVLSQQDIAFLEMGAAQILPPDKQGRIVIYWHGNRVVPKNQHKLASLRCLFYMFHIAAKQENVQKHGVVLVLDTRDTSHESFDRKVAKLSLSYICSGAPLRIRCLHITYPGLKSVARLFLPTKMWFMQKAVRQRTLLHEGCPKELLNDLMEYGLTSDGIPDGLGGGFGAAQFNEWLGKCRVQEQEDDHETIKSSSVTHGQK